MTTRVARSAATTTEWQAFLRVLLWNRNLYRSIATGLGLLVLSAVAVMGSAYCLGLMVDALRAPNAAGPWIYAALFLVFELASVLCRYAGRLVMSYVTVETAYNVRSRLFTKMARVRVDYYDTEPYGRVLTRITSDVEGIERFFGTSLVQLAIAVLEIGCVVVAMVLTRVDLGLIVAAGCIPALAFSLLTRGLPRYWLKQYRRYSASANAALGELLNNISLVRQFGLEQWSSARIGKETRAQLHTGFKMTQINAIIRPVTVVLCFIPLIIVLFLGARWIGAGLISLGVVVTFIRYSERVVNPVRVISHEIQFLQEALVAFMRVAAMLEESEEAVPTTDDPFRGSAAGAITFQNVCLRYRGGPLILRDLSLHIDAGSQTALVGKTGSGKSTVVKALSKLYPIEQGEITVAGHSLERWDQNALRAQIGYVSQDVVAFQGTIRSNLLVAAAPGATDQETMQRLAETGIDEWITALPEGLDTMVSEGGQNLSAGQKQLLAIGRMLLRDCWILILDEATASIDPATEASLHRVIHRLRGRCTTIIIAHRLATVIEADQILVFERGSIIERGSHAELLKTGQFYKELVREQLDHA